MQNSLARDPHYIFLSLILILSVALRFYGLDFQSFWVDELHTMNEADPSLPWGSLFFYLKCCDQHPPLYFIFERLLFSLFGDTEVTARSLSALCGCVSVWGMYLLASELKDRKLGLLAALLTSINFFNIEYSQEARPYIMAMLFSTFSFLYFIKLIKGLQRKHLYLYVLFTLLLLYSHYYSIFIVTAQALVVLIFLAGVKEGRKDFFFVFAGAGALLAAGYLIWVPFLLEISKMHTFWIGAITIDFPITYFFDYFGNNPRLTIFLTLLILYFFVQVAMHKDWSLDKIKRTPLQLMFLIFFTAVTVTYVIPYLRSIYVVPMLYNRYTIVVLPAFILAIAFAFYQIKYPVAQCILLGLFVVFSLSDLVSKKFYSKKVFRKTQFRELTSFISHDKRSIYPIVEERTSWHHTYYLKKYKYDAPIFTGNKEVTVDSILNGKDLKYNVEGFWIVGAHGFEPHLQPAIRSKLDLSYRLVKEREYFDAWAQLYIKRDSTSK